MKEVLERSYAYNLLGVPIYRKLVYIENNKLVVEHYHTKILVINLKTKTIEHLDGFSLTDSQYVQSYLHDYFPEDEIITLNPRELNPIYVIKHRNSHNNSVHYSMPRTSVIIPLMSAEIMKSSTNIVEKEYFKRLKRRISNLSKVKMIVIDNGVVKPYTSIKVKEFIPVIKFLINYGRVHFDILISDGKREENMKIINRHVLLCKGSRYVSFLLPIEFLERRNLYPNRNWYLVTKTSFFEPELFEELKDIAKTQDMLVACVRTSEGCYYYLR